MSNRVLPNANEVQDIKESHFLDMCGERLEVNVLELWIPPAKPAG